MYFFVTRTYFFIVITVDMDFKNAASFLGEPSEVTEAQYVVSVNHFLVVEVLLAGFISAGSSMLWLYLIIVRLYHALISMY